MEQASNILLPLTRNSNGKQIGKPLQTGRSATAWAVSTNQTLIKEPSNSNSSRHQFDIINTVDRLAIAESHDPATKPPEKHETKSLDILFIYTSVTHKVSERYMQTP